MNQFASCPADPLGPTSSMFSPAASSAASSALPFDYYSRYQSSAAAAAAVASTTPGNGHVSAYASPTAMVPYGTPQSSHSYGSSSSYIDYPQVATAYPQPCSVEYFRSAAAKSCTGGSQSSESYPALFSARKYSLDCNNNNQQQQQSSATSEHSPTVTHPEETGERIKREEQEDPAEGKASNATAQADSLQPTAETDDEDYEDDEDDEPLEQAIRTPLYLSPNCILYSYIGTDTVGAINDHFQRSFTMWFQQNMQQRSGEKNGSADSNWNSSGANGDLNGGAKGTNKFWSPQNYYSNYKDVQSTLSGQLSSDTAATGAATIDTTEPRSVELPSKHSPQQQSSPLALKVASTLSSSSASPVSIRAAHGVASGGGNGSNPQSPKDSGASKEHDEQQQHNLDPNTGALVVSGGYSHQTLRSAQYQRRYERRRRRYLKRLQLMHTPMIRRKLPISFWKFSAMFSCYYAGGNAAAAAAAAGYSNSYAVTPYGNGSTGYHHPQLTSPSFRGPQMCAQQQMTSGGAAYGYAGTGYGEQQSDQVLSEVTSSAPYSYEGGAPTLKNESSDCHQAVHHQMSLSSQTHTGAGHGQPYHRPPLSLSVSMTIGGGLGATGQTATTSSATHVTSSNSPTTTTSATSTSAASTTTSSATAAAAAAAALTTTLNNNDLTLDMSIHISPALALAGGAGSAPGATAAASVQNAYRNSTEISAATAPLYHQNHHSSYLGLLQSSLQHQESYHHYYQYSSKFTTGHAGHAAASSSCAQGAASDVRSYSTPYGGTNGSTAEGGGSQAWAAARTGHHPYHSSTSAHYPGTFSQMMIAHRSSATAYPGYAEQTSEVTPELTYPGAADHLSSYSAHSAYPAHHQEHHHHTTSPFIAVAAAAAVRSYQDIAMISSGHHHSGGESTAAKVDADLHSTASTGSQLATSLYLQH